MTMKFLQYLSLVLIHPKITQKHELDNRGVYSKFLRGCSIQEGDLFKRVVISSAYGTLFIIESCFFTFAAISTKVQTLSRNICRTLQINILITRLTDYPMLISLAHSKHLPIQVLFKIYEITEIILGFCTFLIECPSCSIAIFEC